MVEMVTQLAGYYGDNKQKWMNIASLTLKLLLITIKVHWLITQYITIEVIHYKLNNNNLHFSYTATIVSVYSNCWLFTDDINFSHQTLTSPSIWRTINSDVIQILLLM